MSLSDLFREGPLPTMATARRVEPMGAWPGPRPMTPARARQIEDLIARNKAAGKERGARNGFAKLTDAQVLAIRDMRASGMRPGVIAERFNICRTLVWKIEKRLVWDHL